MQVVFEVKPDGEILRFNSLVFEFLFQIYHNFSREVSDTENKKDLVETDLPLKDILDRHGFTNYKLFRKMFNETFGCTPGNYRKNAALHTGV
jgi:AraC-like DNA-binding protein